MRARRQLKASARAGVTGAAAGRAARSAGAARATGAARAATAGAATACSTGAARAAAARAAAGTTRWSSAGAPAAGASRWGPAGATAARAARGSAAGAACGRSPGPRRAAGCDSARAGSAVNRRRVGRRPAGSVYRRHNAAQVVSAAPVQQTHQPGAAVVRTETLLARGPLFLRSPARNPREDPKTQGRKCAHPKLRASATLHAQAETLRHRAQRSSPDRPHLGAFHADLASARTRGPAAAPARAQECPRGTQSRSETSCRKHMLAGPFQRHRVHFRPDSTGDLPGSEMVSAPA